jgi:hypothetical protein
MKLRWSVAVALLLVSGISAAPTTPMPHNNGIPSYDISTASVPSHHAASGAVIDPVIKPLSDFAKGVGKSGVDAAKGVVNFVEHPAESVRALKFAITHPRATATAVRDGIRHECHDNKAQCMGEVVGNVAMIVATEGLGELAELSRVTTGTIDATHVATLGTEAGHVAIKPIQAGASSGN